MQHHSQHSGCDMLAQYLNADCINDGMPGWIAKITPKPVLRFATNRSKVGWYTDRSFFLEAKTALCLAHKRNQIYHFLYGEDSYCYAGFIPHHPTNKIVCSFHQPPDYFDKLVKRKNHLGRLDALMVVSRSQIDYFSNLIGPKKVHFVPHGVDDAYFKPGLDTNKEAASCLFVGHWLRDFVMLKEVIQRVHAKNSQIKFQIVTDPKNHAPFKNIPNVYLYNGLSDDNLVGLYQKANLLVMPMTDCTANNAILEGLACGLPVVTTDVGGVRDYADETCAIFVPAGGSEAMSNYILELLANKPLLSKMSANARKKAISFGWPLIAKQMVDIYTTL